MSKREILEDLVDGALEELLNKGLIKQITGEDGQELYMITAEGWSALLENEEALAEELGNVVEGTRPTTH